MRAAILAIVGSLLRAVTELFGWRKQRDLLDAGRTAERAERAEAALAITKKQSAIIAEQRTSDDAAKRLDEASF